VDDITMQTACELHVKIKNITALVAHGLALLVIPGGTNHGRSVPPGYSVVTVEQIMEAGGQNEKLEIDFVGGDREKTLGEALHGVILWCKAYITLIGNIAAPVDPPSLPGGDNDDCDFGGPSSPPPRPPSPSSPPRARSTLTPPAPAKGKKQTSYLPSTGTPKKRKTIKNKIGPKKKLAYEMTDEELAEHTRQELKDHFKP
jgi:hypothetical protein